MTTAVRTIARETQQDEGNVATTTGYCSNGGGEVDSEGGGECKGSTATTAGYRGNDGGGNEDDSKGNSGKNGERDGNNGGGVSSLSYFLFFWSGSGHGHKVCFLLDTYLSCDDTNHSTPVHVNWRTLSDSSKGCLNSYFMGLWLE